MLLRRYLAQRERSWERLDALLTKAEKSGVRSLTDGEVQELAALYRRATVHLSQLRTRTQDRRLIEYVNSLVARGHALLYVAKPRYPLRSIARLFLRSFPRTFLETWRFQAVAIGLLLASMAASFVATTVQPENAYSFLAAAETRVPGADRDHLLDMLRSGRQTGSGFRAAFSSFLFTHNTKVGLLAFALGVFLCLPTVLLIAYNGLMLGAMSAVHHSAGLAREWWAWVLPHGVTELLAISIISAGGLLMGYALIDPGGRPRLQELARRARQAAVLAVGCVPLFLFAGLVEGFLRQSRLSDTGRLIFAALTAVFWIIFLGTGRRGRA
jgi:uncharacterized membrane protein SpoIIM required for sporulation